MKVNPYVAAIVASLVSGLTALGAGMGDGTLTHAELVSAAVSALVALSAALHLPTPGQAPAAPAQPVVIPMDVEPRDADETL